MYIDRERERERYIYIYISIDILDNMQACKTCRVDFIVKP